MGPEQADGSYPPHDGALYSVETSGEAKMHVPRQGISNGLAWSLDNRTMYFIDSIPRKVYAFDFDINSGSLCKECSFNRSGMECKNIVCLHSVYF